MRVGSRLQMPASRKQGEKPTADTCQPDTQEKYHTCNGPEKGLTYKVISN